jgi:hypothetical protein
MHRRLFLASPLLLLPFTVRAQPLPPPAAKTIRLFTSLSVIGNGADLTEDTLVTYSVPANTFVNVGDELRVVATGGFTGSTDVKTARIRIGGISAATAPTSAATQTAWRIEFHIIKSGSNAQQYEVFSGFSGATGTQAYSNGAGVLTEGSANALTVTGQNTTNSVASSVSVRTVTVDLIRA